MKEGENMSDLLFIFIVLSIINVIFSTIKSIVTVKGGAMSASLISALYYAYYNIVLIYTVAEFPLWQKIVVTFGCNLIGVYVVKWAEEKSRKDKLWKVEATVPTNECADLLQELKETELSFNYVDINKYYLFNIYCPTQVESKAVKHLLSQYNVRYFVSESKTLA